MAPGRLVTYRPGRDADLDACIRTWKAGLEGYQAPLGLPPAPDDLGPLRRLLAHTLATDPDRFWVAVTPAATPVGSGRPGTSAGPRTGTASGGLRSG